MGQSFVQEDVDPVNFLVKVVEIGLADDDAASSAGRCCDLGQTTQCRCLLGDVDGHGDVVAACRLEAQGLHERGVVGRRVTTEEGWRPVTALDEHTIAVLVIEVERAPQCGKAPLLGPHCCLGYQGFQHGGVLDVLQEAEDAFLSAPSLVSVWVFAGADRAHRHSVLPGDEELGLSPAFEESATAWVHGVSALWQ